MPNPKLSIGLALIETSLLKLPAHKAGLTERLPVKKTDSGAKDG
jgi:hypothetical protein